MKGFSMKFTIPAIVMLAVSMWSPNHAADVHHARMTGVYTDMKYNKESGDVVGQEIFVVFSKDGYFAILQSSEGEPTAPVVVPLQVDGTSIMFKVPPTLDIRGDFHGRVSGDHLIGTFSGNNQSVDLKRQNSYWQRVDHGLQLRQTRCGNASVASA